MLWHPSFRSWASTKQRTETESRSSHLPPTNSLTSSQCHHQKTSILAFYVAASNDQAYPHPPLPSPSPFPPLPPSLSSLQISTPLARGRCDTEVTTSGWFSGFRCGDRCNPEKSITLFLWYCTYCNCPYGSLWQIYSSLGAAEVSSDFLFLFP